MMTMRFRTRGLHLPPVPDSTQGRYEVHIFCCKVLSDIVHPCLCLSSSASFSIHVTIKGFYIVTWMEKGAHLVYMLTQV